MTLPSHVPKIQYVSADTIRQLFVVLVNSRKIKLASRQTTELGLAFLPHLGDHLFREEKGSFTSHGLPPGA